jgi:enoyl-CoA hydratase/carnithine racemase
LGLWRDFVLRLSSTPVVSIAKIRGRTRGIGNEFVLACDMRFASRQSVLFGNPGIGVGLVPGGGALEWLPRLVGRSRALESVLSGDDFDADITEHYGWVNRTLDDHELDSFVDALVSARRGEGPGQSVRDDDSCRAVEQRYVLLCASVARSADAPGQGMPVKHVPGKCVHQAAV